MKREQQTLRDVSADKNLVNKRAMFAMTMVVVLSLVLLARLAYLQVANYDRFITKSEENRIEYLPIPPKRGLIYDRNGNLLAENLPVFNLTLVPEQVDEMDATLQHLSTLLGISDKSIERFRRRLKQSRKSFESVVLKENLTDKQVAIVAANRHQLIGVEVEASLIRHYPYGELFAHSLGYVQKISQRDLARIDEGLYRGTSHIGKIGIEKFYENELHGEPGTLIVERDARGRMVKVLDRIPPKKGDDLHLYLDKDLQSLSVNLLAGRRGAVVAIDVDTGGIVTMASTPSFDPNLFVTGFPRKLFDPLRKSKDRPFYDRAANGTYAPASTIKPFLGLAALDNEAVTWNTTVDDPGWFQIPGKKRLYRDWTWKTRRAGHGKKVDLYQAIVESCDTYFYETAHNMTVDPIYEFLTKFGFGMNLTLDVNRPSNGINPNRDWKMARHGFAWTAGDTVNIGIGQGYFLVTPLQIATATHVLARKGDWIQPRVLMKSDNPELPYNFGLIPEPIELKDPSHWDKMTDAMKGVIYDRKGTAKGISVSPYVIAGKTGTAQVKSIGQDEEYDSDELEERLKDHAWFMAYAPAEAPKIAVAVLVENGESGGREAAPIAQAVIDAYLNSFNKEPERAAN